MKGQSPCELFGGLSVFLSRRCWGLRPCVESVQEPEDSTPVLTNEVAGKKIKEGAGYFLITGENNLTDEEREELKARYA